MSYYETLSAIDPLDWNERVMNDKLSDSFGDTMPVWQKWRAKHLLEEYVGDYGSELTVAQKALLQRAITFQVLCEYADAVHLAGKGFDSEDYNRNVRGLRMCLADLGIEKKVTESGGLADALKRKAELRLVSSGGAPAPSAPVNWVTGLPHGASS